MFTVRQLQRDQCCGLSVRVFGRRRPHVLRLRPTFLAIQHGALLVYVRSSHRHSRTTAGQQSAVSRDALPGTQLGHSRL